MIYEITNPSDPYTIETDDRPAACLAVMLLGRGAYGLEPVDPDDKSGMPIFLFGQPDIWWEREFGYPLNDAVERIGRERIAAVLDTVLIGSPDRRRLMTEALSFMDDPAKRQAFRDLQHDRARSSMNDIGGRACRLAADIRANLTEPHG